MLSEIRNLALNNKIEIWINSFNHTTDRYNCRESSFGFNLTYSYDLRIEFTIASRPSSARVHVFWLNRPTPMLPICSGSKFNFSKKDKFTERIKKYSLEISITIRTESTKPPVESLHLHWVLHFNCTQAPTFFRNSTASFKFLSTTWIASITSSFN